MTRAVADPARVVLGRIIGAHGSNGGLRVRWLGDGPENLMRAPRVLLDGEGDTAQRSDPSRRSERWLEVRRAEADRGGEVRIELEGIESREAAAALAGLHVIGEAEHVAPLPEGEHYWFEWIGCAVSTVDGRAVGRVEALWDAGAHDVLVIREEETGRELLLPAVRAMLREVDVEGRRIVVEVPDGLLDASE